MSTGVLVGGIAAGIIGVAAVAFALLYFLRRWKRDDQDDNFDSDVFRRQSVMLRDDAPAARAPSRGEGGFSPRPPTMIERHLASATPVSSTSAQFGHPFVPGNYNFQYNETPYGPSGIAPGQVYAAQNPFHNPYGGPPVVPTHDPTYNGNFPPQPAYLSRQPSGTDIPRQPETRPDEAQYVNMSRSSVTPFQAAQYEEISRRLDIPRSVGEEGSRNTDHPTSPVETPVTPIYQLDPTPRVPTPLRAGPVIPPPAHGPEGKRPDTVYTVYGDDDAYGGI